MGENVKHTPGPWFFDGPRENIIVWQFNNADNRICFMTSNGPAKENARLIAAAPDLLQALGDLLQAYSEPDRRLCCDGRDCGCMGSTVHQQAEHYARLVIAKAEGRP